ncbi:hypothetical protein ACFSKL_22275, partial [Belliella marina]
MRERAVSVVYQNIAVRLDQVDDLVVDRTLVLDVRHNIADYVYRDCVAIRIRKRVAAVAVVGKRCRVCIKRNNRAVCRGMRERAVSVVYQNIAVRLDQVDDLVVDVALVLDVRHNITDYVYRDCVAIRIRKRVAAVAVVGKCHRVCIKGNNRAVCRGMRESAVSVVYQNIAVRLDQVDDLVVDRTLVLDVRHNIADYVYRDCVAIRIRKRVAAVAVVGKRCRVCIKRNNRAVCRGMRERAVSVVYQNIAVRLDQVDDLVVDRTLVLDVRHNITDYVYRDCVAIRIRKRVAAVAVVGK